MIDQAVILCGGKGTRLGQLTQATPKPLLPVGNRPFLDVLILELARHGFRRILLLAGFEAGQIRAYAEHNPLADRFGLSITVAVETTPLGTAGGLLNAAEHLHDRFLLLNGDSVFDINLRGLAADFEADRSALAHLALRELADASRFGTVDCQDSRITCFRERPSAGGGPGLVNAGVYAVSRDILDELGGKFSLEGEVLPRLAENGRLSGRRYDGYFIDIGVPETFAAAQVEIPRNFTRPALFLDRDGVINRDLGYVGQVERFEWLPGAQAAIRMANDRGYFVFVVTNQAGVARGFYTEADVAAVHDKMRHDLSSIGAHVDDIRYCPDHPEGILPAYTRCSERRKPAPGMIRELLDEWPVDRSRSLLIGDQPSDVAAAEAADIPGRLFTEGRLDHLVDVLTSSG